MTTLWFLAVYQKARATYDVSDSACVEAHSSLCPRTKQV